MVEEVVFHGAYYCVLAMWGLSEDATQVRPEFDRLLLSLRLGQPIKLWSNGLILTTARGRQG